MKAQRRACSAAAVVCALALPHAALAQAPPPKPPKPAVHTPPPPDGNSPQLIWDKSIWCMFDEAGLAVRAQCDLKAKLCRYHTGCMGRTRGETCRRLERTQSCIDPPHDKSWRALSAAGVRFERARAEAPPGWTRDESGRVFQTQFDMNRRVWIGGRWAPLYGARDRKHLGRVVLEAGLRAELLSRDTRTRHRFEVLDAELALNPLGGRARLFRYHSSHESELPFLRFTTFWPEPTRHDLHVDIGWWAEVGGIELRPRGAVHETFLRYIAAGSSWDLWHDLTLSSFVRLRGGAALDDLLAHQDETQHRLALTPISALEGDLLFGDAGLHRLTFSSGYEAPVVWRGGAGQAPEVSHRFRNTLAYEVILVAINDQPLSLRLSGEGGYRDDVAEAARGWELRAGSGLRVSFWAPGPRPQDLARVERRRGVKR